MNSVFTKNERWPVAAAMPVVRLLGDFAVEPSGLFPTGRKARALLARLVLADAPLARDRLSALLWSRRPDAQAHASLRQCLVELKPWTRAMPPLLHADRETIALDRTQVADDISLLHAACAVDDVAVVLDRLPAHDVGLLADLDGIDEAWDDWLAVERTRQGEAIVREVLAMAERRLQAGDAEQALAVADKVTRFDPCSEHAARLVMSARWAVGDSDGVRHAWQRIEDALARGIDGRPSVETAELYKRLSIGPCPLDRHAAAAPSMAASPAASLSPRRALFLGIAALALALTGADAPRSRSAVAAFDAPMVRVEPIELRGSDPAEDRFADALAGDFARFAKASGGAVRVLDGKVPGRVGDFVVRVAIERDGGQFISESRIVDSLNGAILWSSRFAAPVDDLSRLRERTALAVAGLVNCALTLNGRNDLLAADADRRSLIFAICDADTAFDGPRAIRLMEELVRRWPGDADTLGLLAQARVKHLSHDMDAAKLRVESARAVETARRALAIDPDNAPALTALSQTSGGELFMVEALPLLDRALAIDPEYPAALMTSAVGLFQAGYVHAGVELAERAARADPTSIYKALGVVRRYAAAGQMREAMERFAEVEAIWPGHPDLAEHRQRLAVELGRDEAAEVYRIAAPEEQREFDMLLVHQFADPSIGSREVDAAAEAEFARYPSIAYLMAAHFTRLGDLPRARSWLARAPIRKTDGQWSLLYWPSVAPLRRDPQFFAKLARIGLVDFWRRQDRWPDFCNEPGLRYDCKSEAERLVRLGRAVSGGSVASR
ncbi:SARP family transcriptional regulator [Sphingopyxis fribergensis]|uniref:SARP family transcriptional regulator n=1 Tax=Sphingopyxis fribergensis TaxID=1515612 RepID=A0A0A7PHD2_9SPHN|nr:BTAD domain-containing putative transcriptional regulator [Sphingopyxis fribergensis]AJA07347.1 SARP family transcriptional regulator [Sphingopyxis fribergensis]